MEALPAGPAAIPQSEDGPAALPPREANEAPVALDAAECVEAVAGEVAAQAAEGGACSTLRRTKPQKERGHRSPA